MVKKSAEIIKFPNARSSAPNTADEVLENVHNMRQFHIQETITSLVPMIFSNLAASGFEFIDDDSVEDIEQIKDGALLVEAIRSMMCRYHGIPHPFQQLSAKIFVKKEEGLLDLNHDVILDVLYTEDEEED